MAFEPGDTVEISVRGIANGYLVSVQKHSSADGHYRTARTEQKYYGDFGQVEDALVDHLVEAIDLSVTEDSEVAF